MLNIPWIREYWFLNIVDMKIPIFVMSPFLIVYATLFQDGRKLLQCLLNSTDFWHTVVVAMYVASTDSILISIRCVFRVIEFATGFISAES